MNRVWLHHFGRGIVNSPGDFGKLGELPTHPELLDYLAKKFVDSGWSLKAMHREMVLSRAYRQSSVHAVSLAKDPDNTLFGRFKVRRLDAEAVRGGLARAGISMPDADFAGLLTETIEHASRIRARADSALELEKLHTPRLELPTITDGVDLGSLYELAEILAQQGVR
jgi:hypothetical protein